MLCSLGWPSEKGVRTRPSRHASPCWVIALQACGIRYPVQYYIGLLEFVQETYSDEIQYFLPTKVARFYRGQQLAVRHVHGNQNAELFEM